MTVHTHFEPLTDKPAVVVLTVSGVGGGAAANMTSVKGATSIVYASSTGLYTVTLPRAYSGGLLGIHFATQTSATAANFSHCVTANTVSTDGKFTVACLSSASNSANAPALADRLTTDTLIMTVLVQDTASKPAGR